MDTWKTKKMVKELRIKGGYAGAFEVREGEFLQIIDLEGSQVADFIAFNSHNPEEKLSPTHTRTSLLSLKFSVGDKLRTNFRNPILKVIEDTVESHDFMIAACDAHRYLVDYGVDDHRSCVDNFDEILSAYNISRGQLPDPFNIFQHTAIESDGRLVQLPSTSKPGDYLLLRAEMDIIGAVSSCPMDLNPIGGQKISDIQIRIFAG